MPITITNTVSVNELKAGDQIDDLVVEKVKRLEVNADVKFKDVDKVKRMKLDAEVTVTRQVNTWRDEMDKAQDGLAHGVEEVVKVVDAAVEGQAREAWLAKLADTTSTRDLLSRLGWDTESMMIDLQVEAKLQVLAAMLQREDKPKHEIILMFLNRMREELIDWSPNRSTSVSSNMVADAEHLALRKFVKDGLGFGHGFSTVQFYTRYIERLAAAAPADLDTMFDRDVFKMMED